MKNYFNEKSLQSIYWAGFIAARGNFINCYQKTILTITVSNNKEERLHTFLEHINNKFTLIKEINRYIEKRNKNYISKQISIDCDQWLIDLKNIYNLPSKVNHTSIPNLIKDIEIQAYLLGYLDAGLNLKSKLNPDYNRFSILIHGDIVFLKWINCYIDNWHPSIRKKATPTKLTEIHSSYRIFSGRAKKLYNTLSNLPVNKSNIWNNINYETRK